MVIIDNKTVSVHIHLLLCTLNELFITQISDQPNVAIHSMSSWPRPTAEAQTGYENGEQSNFKHGLVAGLTICQKS